MTVRKSIIESFELSNGQTVYVQASSSKSVSLSFDNSDIQYMQCLTKEEAIELASKLNQVVGEVTLYGAN